MVLQPGVALQVSEVDAAVILEKLYRKGVSQVEGAGPQAEVTALLDAKSRRVEFLERLINQFREQNAIRKATGGEILMPREHHRKWLRELKALQEEMKNTDSELLADFPLKSPQVLEDVAGKTLIDFGIDPKHAPLVPGLDGLSDIS